jgi:hypothetical protein
VIVSRIEKQVISPVLEQKLTTPTTRGDWQTVSGDDRYCDQTSALESNEVAHERALGAQRQSVTRVFDI